MDRIKRASEKNVIPMIHKHNEKEKKKESIKLQKVCALHYAAIKRTSSGIHTNLSYILGLLQTWDPILGVQ